MTPFLALALVLAAADPKDPKADLAALLKTFREEFVAITPGQGVFPASFSMGSKANAAEQPVHQVTLKHAFQMAKYEVPQNLWTAVMGRNPSEWQGPRNSVERLSYDDAVAFCQRATTLMRQAKLIEAGQEIRLPSEAEWEYCARAGTTTVYSFGDKAADLDAYGWHTGNAAGNDPPVGAKKPNAWKLYDMHGYLWEWCSDPWHDTYEGAPVDGSAWQKEGDDARRVLRSGSWREPAEQLTSSHRRAGSRDLVGAHVGLRCVLGTVSEEKK